MSLTIGNTEIIKGAISKAGPASASVTGSWSNAGTYTDISSIAGYYLAVLDYKVPNVGCNYHVQFASALNDTSVQTVGIHDYLRSGVTLSRQVRCLLSGNIDKIVCTICQDSGSTQSLTNFNLTLIPIGY